MGKTKDVKQRKASVVFARANDGLSYQDIANKLKIQKSTVERIVKRNWETGSSNQRIGSGRPRKTSPHDDNAIKCAIMANPLTVSSEIAASLPVAISASTVCRQLVNDFKLHLRTPAKNPLLNAAERKKRALFCK